MTAGSVSLVVVARVRRGLVCGGAAAGVCLLLAGCAGPVLDYGGYRHAALNTAMAMVSSLAAAQLAGRTICVGGTCLRSPMRA
jgi:hypothetical protein